MIRNRAYLLIIIFFIFICNPILVAQEDTNDPLESYTGDLPFAIQNIVIKGNERVSSDTILTYSEVKEGDTFSNELSGNIIKKLYATKFFDDIDVILDFNTLVIVVKEKPITSEITIEGNTIIDTEPILVALENVGISRTRPFDKNIFDKVEQELVRLYYDNGRYNAKIDSSVIKLARNRVSLALLIDEGEASKIQGITIIGNKNYSYNRITGLMDSGVISFYAILSERDVYSGPRLQSDLDRIKDFYLNEGYTRFKILSHQVNLANDNRDIFITINISEGEIYKFGDLKLFGNTVIPIEDAKKAVNDVMKPGQLFSRSKLEVTKNRLAFLLGDRGYAFPDIIAVPIINDETRVVDIEFRVNPGTRTTVRRINITGNESTNDEVYRREIRQFESSVHSNSKIERSKIRLQRLKYVESVEVKKIKVFESNDQVDIFFDITERASGEFKIGAGWSDSQGTLLNATIRQDNFLGTGNNVAFALSQSSVTKSVSVVYTDPYFTPDGIARSTNFVYAQTDVSSFSTASYVADTFGGGIFYTTPVSETESFGLGYDILYTDYTTTIGSPIIVTHHIDKWGRYSLGADIKTNYISDNRDRTFFALRGNLHTFTLNMFAPIVGASYLQASYKGQYNFPYLFETFGLFDWQTVFRIDTQLAAGAGLFGATSVPFHSKFFAGGTRSVRGFKAATLGPLTYNDPSSTKGCTALTCDAIGGDFLAVSQFNWVFPPPPFMGVDSRVARFSLFMDIGNVFEKVNDFKYDELRASVGIQLDFLTPVGRVSIGFVDILKEKVGDDTQPVVFQLGGTF